MKKWPCWHRVRDLQALIDRVHEKEGMIAVVISNKKMPMH